MNGRMRKTEWVVLKHGHLYVSDFTGKKEGVIETRFKREETKSKRKKAK